jgi:hypothetical protein
VSGIIALSTVSNVRCRAETANPPGALHSTVMATILIHLIKEQCTDIITIFNAI